jgi:hypothetical protein
MNRDFVLFRPAEPSLSGIQQTITLGKAFLCGQQFPFIRSSHLGPI